MDLEGQLCVRYIESEIEKSFLVFIIMQQVIPPNICPPAVTESTSVAEFLLRDSQGVAAKCLKVAIIQT